VLRGLARWREIEAMARNIPRRHLLSDEVLVALAKASPDQAPALRRVPGLSERARARYGQTLLATIETAGGQGPVALDAPLNLRPHTGTLDRFKQIVRRVADTLTVPPELLASRRRLEALLVSVLENDDIPLEFRGWRFDVVTKPLLDSLHVPI
jgi:ribonuclease D